jgi:hypothetical protein
MLRPSRLANGPDYRTANESLTTPYGPRNESGNKKPASFHAQRLDFWVFLS